MSTVPSLYTDLFPKRDDITGSNNKAFRKGKDVLEYVIGGIKDNTIAAVGTIAPGAPKMLIGNASNKLGEFSCVALPLSSLRLFRCITKQK